MEVLLVLSATKISTGLPEIAVGSLSRPVQSFLAVRSAAVRSAAASAEFGTTPNRKNVVIFFGKMVV